MRTLLKFEADWCGPCQQIKPIVNDVLADREGELELRTIDVDNPRNVSLVQQFGVRAIPTLVLMEGETVVNIHRGALGRSELEHFVSSSVPA
jgi:thioredoxin-like negative regulator of GroEL